MKITIEIPEEFEEHWKMDNFYDSLQRLKFDANTLAGVYEIELIDMLCNAFKNIEQNQGEWVPQYGGGYRCSKCGGYALDMVDGNFIHVAERSKFCPNCGAEMEKK